MISKRNILAAAIAGLGLVAANAYATAPATAGASFTVAKHGADDPTQPCDDHGTNLCYVAQHGADNPVEPELELLGKDGADNDVGDDNGVDSVVAKDGADNDVGDDNGVDFVVAKNGADNPIEIEGPDDNGTDIVA
jgi:hypothetical protein